MTENYIGTILFDLRKRKRVTQGVLCKGLCTPTALSRYENGTRLPDRLLFQALFQRLGICSDKFLTTLSVQEYDYFQWKSNILREAERHNWDKAYELLRDPLATNTSCNEVLQRQFYLFIKGIITEHYDNDLKKSLELLDDAIKLTVPDLMQSCQKGDLLSTVELNMILLFIEKAQLLNKDRVQVSTLLRRLILYIELHFPDSKEKVKVYPKALCIQAKYIEEEDDDEKILLYKRALRLLIKNYSITNVPEIIDSIILHSYNPDSKFNNKLRKQKQTVLEIYEDYNKQEAWRNNGIGDSKQEIYLINEVIRNTRLRNKISQEKISEGICSAETYSRIETGRTCPSYKNYVSIIEKLDIDWKHYQTVIESDQIELLISAWELGRASVENDLDRMGENLEILKKDLDFNINQNAQFYELYENSWQFRNGMMSAAELLEKDKEVLAYTVPYDQINAMQRMFSNVEIILLSNIALACHLLGQDIESISILKLILDNFFDSKVELSDHREQVLPILNNLNNLLVNQKRYEEAIQYADLGIDLSLECNICDISFIGCIMGKAYALELSDPINNKNLCSKLYKQAFYLSDLIGDNTNHEIVKRYYEDNYSCEEQWY